VQELKDAGWTVFVIWERELKDANRKKDIKYAVVKLVDAHRG